MVRKLELEALTADAAVVRSMLAERNENSDPIGWHQLTYRLNSINRQIQDLAAGPEHRASVALFFGGGPVVGSRGIQVDFAGEAVRLFQDLVGKRLAAEEGGDLGRRGPVAFRAASDLLLTDVVRGSVGLVLEEADQNELMLDSELRVIVDEVAGDLVNTAALEATAFLELLEKIDPRYLASLAKLFELMDAAGSTLRVVEGDRDATLDAAAIRRGRERTDAARIEERDDDEFSGSLFLLPAHRRFELADPASGTTIYGTVARAFARGRLEELLRQGDVVGRRWRVRLRVRTLQRPNAEPKVTYELQGLVGLLD